MYEVFEYVLTGGFNINKCLLQTNQKGKNDSSVPRIPPIKGNTLLLALFRGYSELYQKLWNDNWINVWGPKHFTMLADVLARQGPYGLI